MIILIVDDESSIVELWKLHLKPLDCELRTAHGLREALIEMRKVPPPDLVLLDLRLPPDSAEAVISEIKTLRAINPNAAIIIVSGLTTEQINDLLANVNVDGKITKDEAIVQTNLLHVVQKCLVNSKGIAGSSKVVATIGALLQTQTA